MEVHQKPNSDVDWKLIEEVRKHDMLYNMNSPDYKRKDITDRVWLAISATVSLDVNKCKRRWKNLRDAFTRCKREQMLPSSSGTVKRRKWKYYDKLSFIEPLPPPKSSREPKKKKICPRRQIPRSTVRSPPPKTKITLARHTMALEKFLEDTTETIKKIEDRLDVRISSASHSTQKSHWSIFLSELEKEVEDSDMTQEEIYEMEAQVTALVSRWLKKPIKQENAIPDDN